MMDARDTNLQYLDGIAAWENPLVFDESIAAVGRSDMDDGSAAPGGGTTMIGTIPHSTERARQWRDACALEDLTVGTGTCVLVEGVQVALFRIDAAQARAVQNICPHKAAAVMHQGLVGEKCGHLAVFCPLHKRAYSLDDGRCLEEEKGRLRTWETRVVAGRIEILH